MINQLVDGQKQNLHILITDYLFSSKNSKEMLIFLWSQLLGCEALLLFSVVRHCKLNIFGFWTVGRTKQDI